MSSKSAKNNITVEELLSYLDNEWKEVLNMETVNWNNIIKVLNKRRFLPSKEDIFNALNHCHPDKIKCVIIGQDPYPTPGNAHGYSFSVREEAFIPASLRNIFKELSREYNMEYTPDSGCLTKWADEGVLMLNSILTVEPSKPKSHEGIGWEEFTKQVLNYIDEHYNVVFLAWGRVAMNTLKDIVNHGNNKNNIIYAGHPSPLNSANKFVGCNCFIEANKKLVEMGVLPIRWTVLYS